MLLVDLHRAPMNALLPQQFSCADKSDYDVFHTCIQVHLLQSMTSLVTVCGMADPHVRPAIRARLTDEVPGRRGVDVIDEAGVRWAGAIQPDPMGRTHTGFRPGLSTAELWDRGRGLWKSSADRILAAELLLIVYNRAVQLVGTIQGVMKHGDTLEIVGVPLPDHPLIGKHDPLDNNSHNPIAYGQISTETKE